jgi:transposase
MRQLQLEDAEIMTIAIQQEISRSEEARYDHRLHGVLLIGQGMNCYEVAQLLGQDPVTVQRWVKQFNQHGFAGLHEGERPGRPGSLSARQWEDLGRKLRRDPRDLGYNQNLWDGKLLAHHLISHYGVALGVRQCQRIFGQMGFRLRKPRPEIAKGDPVTQAAYKKTPAPGSSSTLVGEEIAKVCS